MAVNVRPVGAGCVLINYESLSGAPNPATNPGKTLRIAGLPAYSDGSVWRSLIDDAALVESSAIPQTKSLFAGAATSFKNILIFGDSQETAPGGAGVTFIPALNLEAFKRYGAPSKLPWYSMSSFSSSGAYCIASAVANAPLMTETSIDPPNTRRKATTATSLGPLSSLRPDGGLNTTLTDFGGIYFPPNTGNINYELIAFTNPSGPSQIRILQTTNTAEQNYFGTVENTFIYNSTNMSASDGDVIRVSVGPITYQAARPIINIYSQGWSGSAVQVGHVASLARFSDSSRDQGIAFTTWSAGGQSVSNLLTTKPNIGPTTQAAGPWDLVMVMLGTNDAGGGGTIAEQKTRYQNLINQIRTWTANPNQLILLVSEPPRLSFNNNPLGLELFSQQITILAELSSENSNVEFMDLREILATKYPGFGVASADGGLYLVDTVHLTTPAATLAAQEFFDLVES